LLLNIALHGMEAAAGVRYHESGARTGTTVSGAPVLVRYADDALVLCHSREQAEQSKRLLADWLAPRGLVFNEDKTRIVHLDQGCDFLGFTIRRFTGKLIIKPSNAATKRIRQKLRSVVHSLYGANAAAVVRALVPIIRGWAAYYRTAVSSQAFARLDNYLWGLLYKWATRCHTRKSKRWVVDRYFGRFNKSRKDRWTFGVRDHVGQHDNPEDRDNGAYVPKFQWTKIVRHVQVKGRSSPDDPHLLRYWADRGRKQILPALNAQRNRLLRQQRGRCAACGDFLLHADQTPQTLGQWEQWAATITKAIRRGWITEGPGGQQDECLIHASCRSRVTRPSSTATPARLA
jgi:RNA-directed DNA polymerase